ncbi:hypothetical protein MUK42_27655 [Musa troglodytarum]|uniref:Leucine-rich repeat-containing N-terminal plant-type domain-containing protein n=1 Tax=Musa troglodytarum TaxID=320322 RepID=A0A9E7LDZ6_9LILI|nr:hypothetical protein MUK42_27655 [Musa troglodytarum]
MHLHLRPLLLIVPARNQTARHGFPLTLLIIIVVVPLGPPPPPMEREALLEFKAGIHDTHNRLSSWVVAVQQRLPLRAKTPSCHRCPSDLPPSLPSPGRHNWKNRAKNRADLIEEVCHRPLIGSRWKQHTERVRVALVGPISFFSAKEESSHLWRSVKSSKKGRVFDHVFARAIDRPGDHLMCSIKERQWRCSFGERWERMGVVSVGPLRVLGKRMANISLSVP